MTLTLTEGAMDALAAYLQANMAAKVVVINARYADAFVVPDIKQWYKGNFPTAVPEPPAVVIVGGDWTVRMQKLTDLYGDSHISVVVLYGDDDPETRFRVLSRYAVAVIELLNVSQASIGYSFKFAGPVSVTDTLRTPMFLQGVTIPIALEKMESI